MSYCFRSILPYKSGLKCQLNNKGCFAKKVKINFFCSWWSAVKISWSWVYVGINIVWCHRSTMTITTTANHVQHRRKWPPIAPPTWSLVPLVVVFAPWATTPGASGNNLEGYEGVYGPQNTLILWWCIISGTKEHFEGHLPSHSQPPHELYPLAREDVAHHSNFYQHEAQCLMWDR